ncbi:unnamed protein product [Strongylus vulgaris]|uniref:BMERB domain-containing protein n=1 Tax=Strongylus vulgaris TaxID=40348 RepID=A0A3P7JF45_STRVU|nr:unnamed protein product [Strongylus vulgaris]
MLRRRSAGVPRPSEGATVEDRRTASTSKLRDIFKNGGSTLDEALDDFEIATCHLRKMKEAEAEVRDAEKHLNVILEKEKRMEKELHKLQHPGFFSRSKPGDTLVIRHHLRELLQVIQQREKAERQLADTRAECEVVKMYRFRHGMKHSEDDEASHYEWAPDGIRFATVPLRHRILPV